MIAALSTGIEVYRRIETDEKRIASFGGITAFVAIRAASGYDMAISMEHVVDLFHFVMMRDIGAARREVVSF